MKTLGALFFLAVSTTLVTGSTVSDSAALEKEAQTTASVTVNDTFIAEFYKPDGTTVLFTDSIPFTNVNPNSTFALPNGRSVGDNKSDVGIYCKSNISSVWYLKIGITAGNIPEGKLKYWLSQPYIWTGTASVQTDGVIIPDPPEWTPIPKGKTTAIYRSGPSDTVNMPFGTLITLSFQLDPAGLIKGSYAATITYTMSTAP